MLASWSISVSGMVSAKKVSGTPDAAEGLISLSRVALQRTFRTRPRIVNVPDETPPKGTFFETGSILQSRSSRVSDRGAR